MLTFFVFFFQAIRAEVLDHRPADVAASSDIKMSSAAAAALNIDEILELCADYERQIDEERASHTHASHTKQEGNSLSDLRL